MCDASLIDLITAITPSTNLRNKKSKFWVSARQIVFHFGNISPFCPHACLKTNQAGGCGDSASVADVGSALLAQVQQIWAAESVSVIISKWKKIILITKKGARRFVFQTSRLKRSQPQEAKAAFLKGIQEGSQRANLE